MKRIVEFPVDARQEESGELFEYLIDRAIQYLEFLKENAIEPHKDEWSERLIAVLRFLGDYKLDDDLKSIECPTAVRKAITIAAFKKAGLNFSGGAYEL